MSPRTARLPRVLGGALVVALAGCSSAGPTSGGESESSPAAASTQPSVAGPSDTPESGGDPVALEPGGLEAGVRHVAQDLGISFQPDDGWFAVFPQGGDIAMSKGDVTVYVLVPQTVLATSGPPTPAPADPQDFIDALAATPIVEVTTTEPFEAGGLTGISAELVASGGGPDHPLLTSGSGEYGLNDGEVQWIVLEVDGRVIALSIERAEPDIDEAWAVAGPLVESIEAAP